jgi:hypothetical protein
VIKFHANLNIAIKQKVVFMMIYNAQQLLLANFGLAITLSLAK